MTTETQTTAEVEQECAKCRRTIKPGEHVYWYLGRKSFNAYTPVSWCVSCRRKSRSRRFL